MWWSAPRSARTRGTPIAPVAPASGTFMAFPGPWVARKPWARRRPLSRPPVPIAGYWPGGQFSGRALKSRLTFRYHPTPAMGFFQRPFMAGSAPACAVSKAPTISRRWRSRALMMSSPVSPSSNRSQVPPNCWQSWFSCCASPDVDGGVRDGRRSADLAAGIDTRTGRRADASSILTGSTFFASPTGRNSGCAGACAAVASRFPRRRRGRTSRRQEYWRMQRHARRR